MFCRNCGTKINDQDRFCYKCGYDRMRNNKPIGRENDRKIDDNEVKYKLKPEFNVVYRFIINFSMSFVFAFFICFGFTDIYELWFIEPNTILFTIGAMLVYAVLRTIFDKWKYSRLEYNFYNRKVEYKGSFWIKEEKELKYDNIIEIIATQNFLERIFEIGTIRIYTDSLNYGYQTGINRNRNRKRSGIFINCVGNVGEKYKIIKEITNC